MVRDVNNENNINQKNKKKIGENARLALNIINKYRDDSKNEDRKRN